MLKDISDFLFDKTKKISNKIFYFLLVAIVLLLIDNHLNFSRNYTLSNKLDNVSKINNIIKNDSSVLSNKEVLYLTEQRKVIIESKTIFEKTYTYTKDWITSTDTTKKIVASGIVKAEREYNVKSSTGYFISSTYLYLAIAFFALLSITTTISERKVLSKKKFMMDISYAVIAIIGSSILGIGFYFLCQIIPLFDRTWINHIINIFLQNIPIMIIIFPPALINALKKHKLRKEKEEYINNEEE